MRRGIDMFVCPGSKSESVWFQRRNIPRVSGALRHEPLAAGATKSSPSCLRCEYLAQSGWHCLSAYLENKSLHPYFRSLNRDLRTKIFWIPITLYATFKLSDYCICTDNIDIAYELKVAKCCIVPQGTQRLAAP